MTRDPGDVWSAVALPRESIAMSRVAVLHDAPETTTRRKRRKVPTRIARMTVCGARGPRIATVSGRKIETESEIAIAIDQSRSRSTGISLVPGSASVSETGHGRGIESGGTGVVIAIVTEAETETETETRRESVIAIGSGIGIQQRRKRKRREAARWATNHGCKALSPGGSDVDTAI